MLIGVVSDSHGRVEYTLAAVRMLESLDVAAVLHCGDIGSAEIVRLFARWPTHFVFGNVDYNEGELTNAIKTAGQTCHGQFGSIELAGRRIALIHSHDAKLFRKTINSGDYDLVCYGHTHVAKQERIGKTLVLNPGAIYRATPHSIATVDLSDMQVNIITV